MKRRGFIVLLALALIGSALACGALGGAVQGSGRVVKSEVEVDSFSGVTLAAAGNLIIETGEEGALVIEADDNLVEYFDIDVEGRSKMLTIQVREGTTLEPSDPVNFYLTVEELDTIVVSGSGDVAVESDLQSDQFSINVSGSGDIEMSGLRADDLEVDISGSGNLEIKGGQVGEQTVTVSGSGEYDAEGMSSGTAGVDISGSGLVTLWAVDELTVNITGSGSVRYKGSPAVNATGGTVEQIP